MEEGKRYYRLGLFVVVSITILAALFFVLGGRKLFQPTYTFETYFDTSVAGLEIGAPLRYRGVPLGQVSEILTSGATYESAVPFVKRRNYIVVRAKVTLSAIESIQVERDAQEMVNRGLRAQTQLAGITGQQYLSLDFLSPPEKYPPLEFEWTPRYRYIPSAPSLAGEIVAKAQQLMASLGGLDLKSTVQKLDTLLTNLNGKIDEVPLAEISADAKDVLRNANATIVRVDRLVANSGLDQSLDNVKAVTGSLRTLTNNGSLDRTIARIDEAVERLNGLMGDNQYDVRVIVQDLRATSENLRQLSATIKRDPGALIAGPPKKIELPVEKSP
jgi:ABC-type transporter Mla subunit MlaD